MAFDLLPAIDVAGGRLARFTTTGTELVEAFGGDPLAAAAAFVEAGATWLHVVDMDLARTGRPANVEMVRVIAGLGVPVQASGGVTSAQQIDALRSAGAARVVLGSAALADRHATRELLTRMGDALVVAIEADGPTIRPRSGGGLELPLGDTLRWLAGCEVARFLFVEVGRVGGLDGPDLDAIRALVESTGRPVLASGGVRDVEDLQAIAALGPRVEGAVIGRALHDGRLDLAAAIAALR